MPRIALSIIAVTFILLTVAGSAATLGLASTGIGAGQASVASCGDVSGVTRSYTISGGQVTEINLANFPAGCEGGQTEVTVVDSAGTAVSSGGPQPIVGEAVTISLSPQPSPSQVGTTHVVVAGP